jgi:hypothetical protein
MRRIFKIRFDVDLEDFGSDAYLIIPFIIEIYEK